MKYFCKRWVLLQLFVFLPWVWSYFLLLQRNRKLKQILVKKNMLWQLSYTYIHIHNWSLQLQDYWPTFSHHLCYVVCVLYISGGTYSLKSTPNDRFFEKLFMAVLIILRVFARNLLRGNRRRNTFRILFWCLDWGSNPGLPSNKTTLYILDHGDFSSVQLYLKN